MHNDNRRSEVKAHRAAAIHPTTDEPDQPQHQLSVSIQQTRIPRELLDTLQAVEELVEQRQFAGDVDEFLNVLENYLPHLSESSMLFLLRQRAEAAHPGYHLDWLATLSSAMRTFFRASVLMVTPFLCQALFAWRRWRSCALIFGQAATSAKIVSLKKW